MNADQIVWARAVAEESYDGQLIRDLCNALEAANSRSKFFADANKKTVAAYNQFADLHEQCDIGQEDAA